MTTSTAVAHDHHDPADRDRGSVPEPLTWKHGHVAWFNREHGFGFLDPDDGSESVFLRRTAIAAPGERTLQPGQRVVFTAAPTPCGPEATQVLTYPGTPAPPPTGPRHRPRHRWWTRLRPRPGRRTTPHPALPR